MRVRDEQARTHASDYPRMARLLRAPFVPLFALLGLSDRLGQVELDLDKKSGSAEL
jgi:hypothetical protein